MKIKKYIVTINTNLPTKKVIVSAISIFSARGIVKLLNHCSDADILSVLLYNKEK